MIPASANKYRQYVHSLFIAVIITFSAGQANAQLTGFQSVYFQNQYLANPAMAGLDKGVNLNAGYQQQWTTLPGSPKLQNLTVDYNSGNRVGLGLTLSNDNAGLISRTRFMGTYAYHLPLSDKNDKLSFGLSLGINDTYIDYNTIVADPGDASAQNFNQRNLYVDGDLGVSYTSDGLNVQAAVPNLKSLFFANQAQNLDVDRSTFYTALSYKIPLTTGQSAVTMEPKAAYRGVKGFSNIFDAGANIVFDEHHINFSGMYHSNQSATLAFGVVVDTMGLMVSYTNNTGPLRTYANNTFEIGLNYRLGNK